jgi:hypothetical protein
MGLLQPVSFAQQRLWFLEHLEPGTSAYNLPRAIRITGILDVEALRRALDAIVQRHESLRMTFTDVDGKVMASLGPGAPVDVPVVSLESRPEDQKQAQAAVMAGKEGQRPFNLTTGPVMRVKLVRLSHEQHILVLTLHHIITDGWSMDVLFRELGEFYNAFSSNRSLDIPPLPIQYSDFARWQRKSIGIDVLARDLAFWKKTLSGVPPVLELPADRCRPAFQSHKGRTHRIKLDQELAKDLLDLSRRQGVTLFMTLLAAFETLLWRYTGAGDFVLGTPIAGRDEVDLEQIVGLFANTLPLRAKLDDNPTVRDLLRRVRDTTLDAIAHQDVPFEKLVEDLRPERSMSYTPLFQIMFILQNAPGRPLDFAETTVDEVEFESGLAKFDLTLEIFELDGLYCRWEYSTDLFDESRIVRMAGHFETLLRAIAADPDRRLSWSGTPLNSIILTTSAYTRHSRRRWSVLETPLLFLERIANSRTSN